MSNKEPLLQSDNKWMNKKYYNSKIEPDHQNDGP